MQCNLSLDIVSIIVCLPIFVYSVAVLPPAAASLTEQPKPFAAANGSRLGSAPWDIFTEETFEETCTSCDTLALIISKDLPYYSSMSTMSWLYFYTTFTRKTLTC